MQHDTGLAWMQHVVVAVVVAKGDGEGTDDNAKITKISKCTAPKETKTQFSCEFITA